MADPRWNWKPVWLAERASQVGTAFSLLPERRRADCLSLEMSGVESRVPACPSPSPSLEGRAQPLPTPTPPPVLLPTFPSPPPCSLFLSSQRLPSTDLARTSACRALQEHTRRAPASGASARPLSHPLPGPPLSSRFPSRPPPCTKQRPHLGRAREAASADECQRESSRKGQGRWTLSPVSLLPSALPSSCALSRRAYDVSQCFISSAPHSYRCPCARA